MKAPRLYSTHSFAAFYMPVAEATHELGVLTLHGYLLASAPTWEDVVNLWRAGSVVCYWGSKSLHPYITVISNEINLNVYFTRYASGDLCTWFALSREHANSAMIGEPITKLFNKLGGLI